MVLALPTFRAWVVNLFVLVSTLNASFFSVMPAWFNFLILTVVIAFVLVIANSFRK